MTYIHLKLKTEYSLCKSTITVDSAVAIAKKHGMTALAICDDSNLFGALEFSKACVSAGIQPIIGCTVKVKSTPHAPPLSLSLFAQNKQGYKNLLNITSEPILRDEDRDVVLLQDLLNKNDINL